MNKKGFITNCFRVLTMMTLGMTGVGAAIAADKSNGADNFYK